jgi:N-acyl-D-amino-acid deacylase
MATAIHRMTGLPAHRFKIPDRGRIAPGAMADLVAFDPNQVQDRATYQDPLQAPAGIVHVMVNGIMAIEDGGVKGRNAGHVLSRGGTTHGA